MREFILKFIIILIGLFILFKVTIGSVIETYSSKVEKIFNQNSRIEIKEKLLLEMKKGINKEKLISEEEADIISKFFKKLYKELNL